MIKYFILLLMFLNTSCAEIDIRCERKCRYFHGDSNKGHLIEIHYLLFGLDKACKCFVEK